MEADGYVLIRRETFERGDVGDSPFVAAGRAPINDTVDYDAMDAFVRDDMLKTVDAVLGTAMTHTKYRVSDNNNSTDAAAFHRDVICVDGWAPVITALTYLDDATMEVMPGSHRRIRMSTWEAVASYRDKKTLHMRPGDLLVFYSTLLHRGVFRNPGHRRLVQAFDCAATPAAHATLADGLMHVARDDPVRNRLAGALGTNPLTRTPVNWVAYLQAATGYGAAAGACRTRLGRLGVNVVSSEGSCGRLAPAHDRRAAPQNIYVMAAGGGRDMSAKDMQTCDREFYTIPYLRYGIPVAAGLFALIACVVLLFVWLARAGISAGISAGRSAPAGRFAPAGGSARTSPSAHLS